jgi:hypothetical protein
VGRGHNYHGSHTHVTDAPIEAREGRLKHRHCPEPRCPAQVGMDQNRKRDLGPWFRCPRPPSPSTQTPPPSPSSAASSHGHASLSEGPQRMSDLHLICMFGSAPEHAPPPSCRQGAPRQRGRSVSRASRGPGFWKDLARWDWPYESLKKARRLREGR